MKVIDDTDIYEAKHLSFSEYWCGENKEYFCEVIIDNPFFKEEGGTYFGDMDTENFTEEEIKKEIRRVLLFIAKNDYIDLSDIKGFVRC